MLLAGRIRGHAISHSTDNNAVQRHFDLLDRLAGDNATTQQQIITIVDETGRDRGIDVHARWLRLFRGKRRRAAIRGNRRCCFLGRHSVITRRNFARPLCGSPTHARTLASPPMRAAGCPAFNANNASLTTTARPRHSLPALSWNTRPTASQPGRYGILAANCKQLDFVGQTTLAITVLEEMLLAGGYNTFAYALRNVRILFQIPPFVHHHRKWPAPFEIAIVHEMLPG